MANTIVVACPDAREIARDLESVKVGTGRMVSEVRREAAEIVASTARRFTPLGPGPIAGARHPDDRLPHIRDTITARPAGVFAAHPAALVHEFGGVIHPRGRQVQMIAIRRSAMGERAGEAERSRVEDHLERGMDDLLARAGF